VVVLGENVFGVLPVVTIILVPVEAISVPVVESLVLVLVVASSCPYVEDLAIRVWESWLG
jgi:hypothetical protein